MNIFDKYSQKQMINKINSQTEFSNAIAGKCGSVCIESKETEVLDWKCTGKTEFDRFIKRYGLEATDSAGKKLAWTMASRGSESKSGNVTMIVPIIKDKLGRLWTLLQEEARPIDLFRNGKDSRLFAFPAGIIGDEIIDETAKESALRELTEETGLAAEKIISLSPKRPIPTTPGLTDEATDYFVATVKNLKPKTKALTDGVTKAWWFVPVGNLNKWFSEMEKVGKVASGQTLTALALLAQKTKIKL